MVADAEGNGPLAIVYIGPGGVGEVLARGVRCKGDPVVLEVPLVGQGVVAWIGGVAGEGQGGAFVCGVRPPNVGAGGHVSHGNSRRGDETDISVGIFDPECDRKGAVVCIGVHRRRQVDAGGHDVESDACVKLEVPLVGQ